eukprot:2407252-Amphidinium_carterae.1
MSSQPRSLLRRGSERDGGPLNQQSRNARQGLDLAAPTTKSLNRSAPPLLLNTEGTVGTPNEKEGRQVGPKVQAHTSQATCAKSFVTELPARICKQLHWMLEVSIKL